MANEKITELPQASSAGLTDIIYAVQGYVDPSVLGTSVQMTLSQVQTLVSSGLVQNYAGDPNGNLAGTQYGLCWDTTNNKMYVCTTSGIASVAVWKLFGAVLVSAIQGGTGVSNPTAHTLPVANGSSAFSFKTLANGQLLIGSTGADPVAAGLTAGPGVSISNGAGSITISGTGSGIGWTEVTTTTQAMAADNGYVANNAGLVTLTLPATAAFGTAISVVGKGAGGWLIAQNASQVIQVGSVGSTAGVGGSVASSNRYDSIDLICTTANTVWTALGGPQGALTIV